MSYIELDQKYTEAKDLLATQPINIKYFTLTDYYQFYLFPTLNLDHYFYRYSDVDSAKEVSLFNNQDMYIQFEKWFILILIFKTYIKLFVHI